MTEAEKLTQELVRIDSTNPGAGESRIGEYIASWLSGCGARLRFDQVLAGRRNLFAELEGEESEEALALICHMDTVVIGDGWTEPPLSGTMKNGRIYGRGSCDMKAGLACALTAFRTLSLAVKAGEVSLRRPLKLLCTVDEEGDMQGVERAIESGMISAGDWIIDLEPTDGQIQRAHKGRLWLDMRIVGITAHASKPEQGADAIAAAGEIICRLRREFDGLPQHRELGRSTVTFGKIQGGYQPYVVPDACRLWIDMRLVPPADDKMVLERVEAIIRDTEAKIPGIRVRFDVTGNRPYIERTENSGLEEAVKEACRKVTGSIPEVRAFTGYTDTAVIAGILGNREFLSYGPGNLKMAHKPDEYVETADIERCERVLSELVRDVCVKS